MNEFAEENDFTTLHYSNICKIYAKQKLRFKKKRIEKIMLDEKKSSNPKELRHWASENKQTLCWSNKHTTINLSNRRSKIQLNK